MRKLFFKGVKIMNYFFMGMVIVALLGGSASAFSIFKPFSRTKTVSTVPIKESKDKRSIRCKGEATVNDKGQVVSCSEGFYLDENSENREERKQNLKEKFLSFLGKFEGMLFWAVIGSIGLSFLGMGGVVANVWGNLFGGAIKMAKATFKGIQNFKRNGKEINGKVLTPEERAIYDQAKKDLIKEIQTQQQIAGVEKKVNEIRAKI